MSKGTVFYIGGFELPDKNAAALRVMANGKILRDLGYRVVFIGVDKALPGGADATHTVNSGFECWSVPYPTGTLSWIKYLCGLPAILKILKSYGGASPVAAICYNYPAIASLRIKKLCTRLGIKMLSDATEWYDATGGSLPHRLIKALDTAVRMYIVHPRMHGIITTSRYLTDFYARQGKLTVELPTLFDGARFSAPHVGRGEGNLKFIYVGSPFDVDKVNRSRTNLKERLDTCVEIFHSLHAKGKAFRFDVVGITQSDYLKVFPEHRMLLDEMRDVACFHGRVPNDQVVGLIGESDFSIFFRDRTRVTLAGFPSKLAESISIGTPVVVNRMLSLESFAGSPGIVLADPGCEMEVVESLFALSATQIDSLKQDAFKARTFHYENYYSDVDAFMRKLGV